MQRDRYHAHGITGTSTCPVLVLIFFMMCLDALVLVYSWCRFWCWSPPGLC
jgi:hypothetical protein